MDRVALPPTDKIIIRSKFYKFKKKFFRPTFLLIPSVVLALVILNIILKERAPSNVIRTISYGRNYIKIYLVPETVQEQITYNLTKLSESQYILDIDDSDVSYDSHREYSYGAISRIDREQIDKRKARLTFYFSSLKDEPELIYIAEPPYFKLHLKIIKD